MPSWTTEMAVVLYREGTKKWGPKVFPAPKRADLRGWWNAARKVIPGASLGFYRGQLAEVTYGSIVFDLGEHASLVIQRR